MFCSKYSIETWIAYRARQLDVSTSEDLENHLEHCHECLAELLELNRAEMRMNAFSQQKGKAFLLQDKFVLGLQVKEAIQTLLGEVVFVPTPAIRGRENGTWRYTSSELGILLEFSSEEDGFFLTVRGTSSSFSFSGEKKIFSGNLDGELLFHHLSYGEYTISTEKGRVSFIVSKE